MEDKGYTTRELDHYFKDMKGDLIEIKEQVRKTNGRVNKLEGWQKFIQGGLAIITLLIVPILLFLISNYLK